MIDGILVVPNNMRGLYEYPYHSYTIFIRSIIFVFIFYYGQFRVACNYNSLWR